MMIAVKPAKYAIFCASVIPVRAEDENIVTVHPSAAASAASADDEPPFTLLGKTSTEPLQVTDAFAGVEPTVALATLSAATPAKTAAAGTSADPTPRAGTVSSTSACRTPRPVLDRVPGRHRRMLKSLISA
jgi:hypothetical protein